MSHQSSLTFAIVIILTRGQRLLQFLSLLLVCDDQCVQVSAAADLEFDIVLVLLDFYSCRNTAKTSIKLTTQAVMRLLNTSPGPLSF